MSEETEAVAALPDAELSDRLDKRGGHHPNVVDDLVRDRATAGGAYRIREVLGIPQPDRAWIVRAQTPTLTVSGREDGRSRSAW